MLINMKLINDNSFNNYIRDFDFNNIKEIKLRNDYYKCFNKLDHLL